MCSVTHAWETWECFLEAEFVLGTLVWELIEFLLVSLHLLDEVNKMAWLLELLEVLGINKVAKFILNSDDKLDGIKRIKTMIGES